MHIRVPTGSEGQLQFVGEPHAQNAHFTGAGNVNEVRFEARQHLFDERKVAQICRIETKVLLKRKGKKSARQFESPNIAVFDKRLFAISGTHAKKREIAAARKGLKVPAGVSDSVDFVKGVRKVGNAR